MQITVDGFTFYFNDGNCCWVARSPDVLVKIKRSCSITRGEYSWYATSEDLDKCEGLLVSSPTERHCEEAYQAFLASMIVN